LKNQLKEQKLMSSASSVQQIVRCQQCGANNRVSQSSAKMPVCGRCKTPLAAEVGPIVVTDANFQTEIENSPLPVLLDLWAPWCGPCRMMSPIIDQTARELAGRVIVGKLNVDENKQTAARFRVQSIPTLLVLRNGREIDRLVGSQPKETILRRLQTIM
jgi:thioredoxin 2